MTFYEVLSLIAFVLASIATVWIWRHQGRISALELKLLTRQVADLERDEAMEREADIVLETEPHGSHYRVWLHNRGGVEAVEVRFDMTAKNGKRPFPQGFLRSLPIERIPPGQRHPVPFAPTMSVNFPFDAVVTWTDSASGEAKAHRQMIHAP